MGPRAVAAAVALALGLSACTPGRDRADDERPFRPTYETVDCPTDVALVVLVEVECGTLTVLADRDSPHSAELRLFVARMQPQTGDRARDPVVSLGGALGKAPDYVTLGAQTEGLGREVIVLDARGTGRSEPSLACPEVEALPHSPLEVSVDHPRTRTEFLGAIQECHDRLTSRGVDLSSFGLSEMAADLEDLRIALEIDRWDVMALGTSSRIALEYVREFPEHLRSVVLDSPEWPGLDLFVAGVEATRHAISELAAACSEDAVCRGFTPDFAADVRDVARALEAKPIVVDDGAEGRILFDAGWFIVWLRARLTFIRPPGTFVPHAVAEFAKGSAEAFDQQASRLQPGNQLHELCQLFHPNCWPELGLSFGAYLSVMCRNVVPFTDRSSLPSLIRGEPGFEEAFGNGLLLDACETWNVGSGDPQSAAPVRSDVPTLVIVGRFDAFGTLPRARDGLATLTNGYLVVSAVNGHQVTYAEESLPHPCLVRIRDAWLDDPTGQPDTSCADSVPVDYMMPLDWMLD